MLSKSCRSNTKLIIIHFIVTELQFIFILFKGTNVVNYSIAQLMN